MRKCQDELIHEAVLVLKEAIIEFRLGEAVQLAFVTVRVALLHRCHPRIRQIDPHSKDRISEALVQLDGAVQGCPPYDARMALGALRRALRGAWLPWRFDAIAELPKHFGISA